MPTKLQEYTALVEATAQQITSTPHDWSAFLTTAAQLYKYPWSVIL